MYGVLSCVATDHDLWLVTVAAIICILGCWSTTKLVMQAQVPEGIERLGWAFLGSITAGASIWCTHFVAMLAYQPGVPVSFDPVLTIFSLVVAIVGACVALTVATSRLSRAAPAVGGALLGLSIAAMHYTGMQAYEIQGLLEWDPAYGIAAIMLVVPLSAASLEVLLRRSFPRHVLASAFLLMLAIVTLHFTAMTAVTITPLGPADNRMDPTAIQAMALAVVLACSIILGAGLVSYMIDNRARRSHYRRLRQLALYDQLTNLPNRASFTERLARDLEVADRLNWQVAVIGIDLDRFKVINDVRGHRIGDEVLRRLGQRLAEQVGDGEFVARIGGDEFAAIKRFRHSYELEDFVARLESALTTLFVIEEFETMTSASLGVAVYPQNAKDADTLINNADLAMYRAKVDTFRTICFYEPSMDETVRRQRSLSGDLKRAIERGDLELHYQVQTAVSTGEIRGFEALARWKHPVHGYIPPSEFIPLAENSGMITQIGEWVLRTACREAAGWEPPYKIAVNLSPIQFSQPNLARQIHEILVETGLPPSRLELELTESTIVRDKQRSLHMLRQIKALGVTVALDDFGTGYSSLETLRTFPFDKIKLDKSFLVDIETDPQSMAIIRAVLALGRSLEVPVLVEGIETASQLSVIREEGCDEAQGFLLGQPMPAGQLTIPARRLDMAEAGYLQHTAHSGVAVGQAAATRWLRDR